MKILGNIIQQIQQRNSLLIKDFREIRKTISIQILLNPINRRGLDLIYDMIRTPKFQEDRTRYANPDNIDVIVDSGGGDADAAYHIAKLLHANFKGTITYIIPRFAKSAATLLICGGNKIIMGETSELGPLDPQIMQEDGTFVSAKSVKATLDLIKEQIEDTEAGIELAAVLINKINPLILGEYNSAIEISKEYQKELLLLRMFKDEKKVDKIKELFATGYTHHSRVIGCNEAKKIFGASNLTIMDSTNRAWNLVWEFYSNNRSIADLTGVLNILSKK